MKPNSTKLTVAKPIVERLRGVLKKAEDGGSVTKLTEELLVDALNAIENADALNAHTDTIMRYRIRIHTGPMPTGFVLPTVDFGEGTETIDERISRIVEEKLTAFSKNIEAGKPRKRSA